MLAEPSQFSSNTEGAASPSVWFYNREPNSEIPPAPAVLRLMVQIDGYTGVIDLTRVFLSAVALAAITAVPAKAADLPMQNSAPAPFIAAVPVFTWTGFYAGVNAGAAWDDSRLTLREAGTLFADQLDLSGFGGSSSNARFNGGAQVGYNYRFGATLVGIEADINRLRIRSSYTTAFTDDSGAEALRADQRLRWFGTLRARLGFTPTEHLLVYGTGGLAFGRVHSDTSYIGSGIDGTGPYAFDYACSSSSTRWGWTLGAGAEYAFTNELSLKGEYLYVDLGSKNYAATDPLRTDVGYNVKSEARFHVLRAGLNYKFNTY